MRKVVVNTTPIIALADIGQLDLLQKIYGEIVIPEAVDLEVLSEPARGLLDSTKWIKVVKPKVISQKSTFSTRLHAGEIEVLTLAQECGADLLIIDDNAAKKTAKYLGFTVTGTMGVLLKAKHEGYIDRVKPLMERLIANGLYVSPEVQAYVLEAAEE